MLSRSSAYLAILCCLGTWVSCLADELPQSEDPYSRWGPMGVLYGRWVLVESMYVSSGEPTRQVHRVRHTDKDRTFLQFRFCLGIDPEESRGVGVPRRGILVHPNGKFPLACTRVELPVPKEAPAIYALEFGILEVKGDKLYIAWADPTVTHERPKSFDIYKDRTIQAVTIFERLKEK